MAGFFIDRLHIHGDAPAVIGSQGTLLDYTGLSRRVDTMCDLLSGPRRLLVIECENELDPLVAYLAALRSRTPVLLLSPGDAGRRESVFSTYRPAWHFHHDGCGWTLDSTGLQGDEELHPDLAVLLSTSGSTGTMKLVRLSHENINANALSIAEYLGIVPSDCAATTLPFHYSYGLSVINSYLSTGATLMLTKQSVIDDGFWEQCSTHGVTSFAGVPYTFELLDRINLEKRAPATLRYITQAGGRLPQERVLQFSAMGKRMGWKLVVMYGQTEATARMAYMPPELLEDNPGKIGIAIPGGKFRLAGDDGSDVSAGESGELVYAGPNVMMGYAYSAKDLSLGPQLTELRTGDIARCDDRGLYSIEGRKSRFIKIFGLRISLDEVEKKLADHGIRGVAAGVDELLVVASLEQGVRLHICELISVWSKLPASVIAVIELHEYPLLPSGKVDYVAISHLAAQEVPEDEKPQDSIREIIQSGTAADTLFADSTFLGLGGDSLSYVSVSMELEKKLGYIPPAWETLTVAELEKLLPAKGIWRAVETAVFVRAMAIVLIVLSHFYYFGKRFFIDGLSYPMGSASLLMIVTGYGFARFQLGHVIEKGPMPVIATIVRIFIPAALYMFLTELVSGYFEWPTIFMYSNFYGPDFNAGKSLWFIEMLLQILLVMAALFSFSGVRELAGKDPYRFCCILLAVSTLAFFTGPLVWDTRELFNLVPHMMIYFFAFGACLAFVKTTRQRIFWSLLACFYFAVSWKSPQPGERLDFTFITLFGSFLLLWTRYIWVVWPFNRLAGFVAGASLFIYMTHGNFARVLEVMSVPRLPYLNVVIAIAGGVCLWLGWEGTLKIIRRDMKKVRAVASRLRHRARFGS